MKCIILAGGSGSRLWPWSRANYPKQFLKVMGEDSFLQLTIKRLLHLVSPEDLYIVTHSDAVSEIVAQASIIDPQLKEQILLEPAPKNTAPAIAFAMQALKEKGVDANTPILVCPADHLISPHDAFCDQVKSAQHFAEEGKIVTFGVRPTSPETGYGYIHAKENAVLAFVEKPNLEIAQQYVIDGNYFWNAGIFLFTMQTMIEELLKHAPNLEEPISIDYAVMEKSDRLAMYPLTVTWSDIGSWQSLYDLMDKDGEGNVKQGPIHAVDTKNSLLFAKKRLVATVGLEDMLVVETEDAILVAPKKEAQKVKQIVTELKGSSEVNEPITVDRPWGAYTILEEGPRFKIKRITVHPLQKLSLQMHYHRSEHWVVVKGTAEVTIQDETKMVHEGQSIFVPKSAIHRMANPGKVTLEIIEVQVGEYLGEDDIVRLEDVYGRLKQEESFKLLMEKRQG